MRYEFGPPPPTPFKKLDESVPNDLVLDSNTMVLINPTVPNRELIMTNKAGDTTAQQFKSFDSCWTDDLLVELGYAYWKINDD